MFILASASPRRRDLLAQIGASFRVEVSEAEEMREAKTAEELVRVNALAKARAVAAHAALPVLGADTVVALAGRIFGKPADEREAHEMLAALSGRAHDVLTGVAWCKAGAYAVQGRAAVFVERIEGSFSNVVGLPLHAAAHLAEKAGVDLYDASRA